MNDRRQHLRFDKIFTVYISTSDGLSRGVGRNISARGMFVEVREPVPLGAEEHHTVGPQRREPDVRAALVHENEPARGDAGYPLAPSGAGLVVALGGRHCLCL